MLASIQQLSIGKRGGKVFALSRAFLMETEDKPVWHIPVPSLLFGRKLHASLGCPLPPTSGDELEWSPERTAKFYRQYDRYSEADEWLITRLLESIIDNLLSVREMEGESRMGQSFSVTTAGTPKDIILGQIARGGDKPTQKAKDFFRRNFNLQLPHLWAGSQRVGVKGNMTTVVEVKGKRNLAGKNLFVIDRAVATVTTIPNTIRKWIERCESVPARITVGCIHAAMESLEKLQNMGDPSDASDPLHKIPVDVMAVLVHGGIDASGYLINPGCGDVGVMDVGLRDN